MANVIEIIIKASAEQAATALKGITGNLEGIGSAATRAGVGLTAVTAPLAAFLGTALQQASDAQTAMTQLESVIKSTGGAAGVTADMASELANSLSEVTRFSDDAILSTENLLLTFTSIGRDIFPEVTKTALDMSTALGQDLKSSAMQLGKALNDPITGITALRRVGVQFTDAQEEMIKSMAAAGDVMGAQRLILKELQKEFGGSAEAAGKTFAGQMDILTHKFENFQEEIGFILMPTLEKVIDTLGGVIDKVARWAQENPALVSTLTMLAGVLVVAGPALILIGMSISAIGTIIGVVAPIVAGLGAAFAALAAPIAAVIAVLAALKLAYDNNFLGFKDTVDGIVESLQYLPGRVEVELNNVVGYFQYYIGKIWSVVQPALQPILDWFSGTGEGTLSAALNSIPDWIDQNIVAPLKGIWSQVEPEVMKISAWWETTFLPAVQAVGGWLNTNIVIPVSGLMAQLEPTFQSIANFIRDIFQPVIDVINEALDNWERLRRLGGGENQRWLPEDDPSRPFQMASPGGSKGLNGLDPSELAFFVGAAIGSAIRTGTIAIADKLRQQFGNAADSTKQMALEKGIALGDLTIKKVTEVTDTAHKGISDQQGKAYSAGATIGTVTGDVIRLLGDQAAGGVRSMADTVRGIGVSIGTIVGNVIRSLGASAAQGITGGVGGAVGGLFPNGGNPPNPFTGEGMPDGWVPLPSASMTANIGDWMSRILPPTPGWDTPYVIPDTGNPRDFARSLPGGVGGGAPGTLGGMSSAPQVIFEEGAIVMPGANASEVRGLREAIEDGVEKYYLELTS